MVSSQQLILVYKQLGLGRCLLYRFQDHVALRHSRDLLSGQTVIHAMPAGRIFNLSIVHCMSSIDPRVIDRAFRVHGLSIYV